MPEAEPPGRKDDDSLVLRDAVKVLTQEVQLQKELMSLQNTQFQECRQQLETQSEELHRARQEAALHRTLLERQAEELRQEVARERGQVERQAEELRQRTEELSQAYATLGQARHELSQAQRQLNTRFWRYTRPVRGLLGLFDPKG